MGTWSNDFFGNDTALDMVLNLSGSANLEEIASCLTAALNEYREFDLKKKDGKNISITYWGEEEIERALKSRGLDKVMDDPIYKPSIESLRSRLGETWTDFDYGESEAQAVVAASAIMLVALSGKDAIAEFRNKVRPGDTEHDYANCLPMLEAYQPSTDEISDAVQVLALVLKNKELGRDFGTKWKKGVKTLAENLATFLL